MENNWILKTVSNVLNKISNNDNLMYFFVFDIAIFIFLLISFITLIIKYKKTKNTCETYKSFATDNELVDKIMTLKLKQITAEMKKTLGFTDSVIENSLKRLSKKKLIQKDIKELSKQKLTQKDIKELIQKDQNSKPKTKK
ncbi:hypothetical protein [Candidatus Phytoplasma meliae]|uniref:Uncharacterized protein n=1 Tax=Candidatus Phytoplasma meliae TaxID=1848402 RepID=A0ABS5CY03_9MOLU|nr:hypothetical protein [Candidatus Phytoplasma meliae]MBP5835864.1 hypothetical protein [Candidatus Phytoplasma meliae]